MTSWKFHIAFMKRGPSRARPVYHSGTNVSTVCPGNKTKYPPFRGHPFTTHCTIILRNWGRWRLHRKMLRVTLTMWHSLRIICVRVCARASRRNPLIWLKKTFFILKICTTLSFQTLNDHMKNFFHYTFLCFCIYFGDLIFLHNSKYK